MSVGQVVLTVIGSVLGSTGLFTLIQFLISRHDKKHDKLDGVQRSIDEIKTDLASSHNEISSMQDTFQTSINELNDKIDKNQAIQARIRILRASDEMRQHVHHSYEYFRQLHHDITDYEKYCDFHPDFKNNEAVNSIEYINRVYQECLDSNNFLV